MVGKTVNQTELAQIIGVSDVTLWEWQKDGLPYTPGAKGDANSYDTQLVIEWYAARQLRLAGKAESQRDREARLRGDMLEIELQKERGVLVPTHQVEPVWHQRVMSAAAFMLGRASRLAGELEAAPGVAAKREILKKEDAEFLTKLGVEGARLQQELDVLLSKISKGEADEFLRRIVGSEHQSSPVAAPGGGMEAPGAAPEDPTV